MRAVNLIVLLLMALSVAYAQDSLGVSRLAYVDYWSYTGISKVVGNYAYASAWQSGLHIMDISNAAHPVEVGQQTWAPWCIQDVAVDVQDTLAYVSYLNPGIGSSGSMLDVSDPSHPVELHRWNTVWDDPLDPTDPHIVYVHGNIAVGLQGTEIAYPFLISTRYTALGIILWE